MESDEEICYEVDFDIESALCSVLEDIDVKTEVEKTFNGVSLHVRQQEKKRRDVDRIFEKCQAELNKIKQELEANRKDLENQPQIPEASESDDEIQIFDVKYKPYVPSDHEEPTPATTLQSPQRNPQMQLSIKPQSAQNSPQSSSMLNHTSAMSTAQSQIRSLLAGSTLNQGLKQKSVWSQDVLNAKPIAKSTDVSSTSGNDDVTIISAPQKIQVAEPRKIIVPQMVVGLKILAKKHSDVWYKAIVHEIMNRDGSTEEKRFKVKFDGKGSKTVEGRNIAYYDLHLPYLPVGSRVVAMYNDPNGQPSYYAGIVAEPPSVRNLQRFLIFFDDGYAQYSPPDKVCKVYHQSRNVWEDIHPDSQEFIKEYLQQYPDRPMVRLQKGQTVKTEWNGEWWAAKVTEVDASLVKMLFDSDRRTEWVYRGSTRLGPLYTELAHAERTRASGRNRRHNIMSSRSYKKPYVEYTREDEKHGLGAKHDQKSEQQKPGKQMARKSTSVPTAFKSTATATKVACKKEEYQASSISSNTQGKDIATVLQERLASGATLDEPVGERMDIDITLPCATKPRKSYVAHKCKPSCLGSDDDPGVFKGHNPLLIPLLHGWERQLGKGKGGKRAVFYRTPCCKRLRNMEEIDTYLTNTNSKLTVDLFSYDVSLHTNKEFVPVKTFCDIKDLSYGKENVPISCVNGIDRQYPDYVEYSNQRLPAKGVHLITDPNFLSCCDCTDGCRDKSKCQCWQLTIEATAIPGEDERDPEAGYVQRRLADQMVTGIYECNSKCKCDSRCANRVVQNGLQLRLQVFKTEKRGWGLRCLDDIPRGGFICIYAGQLLTEQGANEDGQAYGDEYLAELDYIEVVENMKEDYESNAEEDEGIGDEDESSNSNSSSDDIDNEAQYDDDHEYSGNSSASDASAGRDTPILERQRSSRRKTGANKTNDCKGKNSTTNPNWSSNLSHSHSTVKATAAWVNSIPTGNHNKDIVIIDSDDELPDMLGSSDQKSVLTSDLLVKEHGGLPKLLIRKVSSSEISVPGKDHGGQELKLSLSGPKTGDFNTDMEADTEDDEGGKRVTRSQNRMKPLLALTAKASKQQHEETKKPAPKPLREFFGQEESCYIMDAKSIGNIGRYLNHSCSPNAFVQNVFVDTHDLRFPWVSFFAGQYIRAGTELTWDYHYEVNSVPGKRLYCYCGSSQCRGRLL